MNTIIISGDRTAEKIFRRYFKRESQRKEEEIYTQETAIPQLNEEPSQAYDTQVDEVNEVDKILKRISNDLSETLEYLEPTYDYFRKLGMTDDYFRKLGI